MQSHGGVPLAKGTETDYQSSEEPFEGSATEVSPSRRGLKPDRYLRRGHVEEPRRCPPREGD